MMVISAPLQNQARLVKSVLAAPTAKCAAKLTMKAVITAGNPERKKKGMTGMIAPAAVESPADQAAELGRRVGGVARPSSSEAMLCRNCRGSCEIGRAHV